MPHGATHPIIWRARVNIWWNKSTFGYDAKSGTKYFDDVRVYNKALSAEEVAQLYVPDTDGDGTNDAMDQFPLDASKTYDVPDLSDTVDSEIGTASGLDSIEGNLALWLDASNINGLRNNGLVNGDAIAEWKDLISKRPRV